MQFLKSRLFAWLLVGVVTAASVTLLAAALVYRTELVRTQESLADSEETLEAVRAERANLEEMLSAREEEI